MKKIKLSKGKFALVDDKDFEFLNQYEWSVSTNGRHGFKAIRVFAYLKNGERTSYPILMHRVIMLSPPSFFDIDHIDCDGLNNQKSNLRICTHSDNCKNIIKRYNPNENTSKFKGVNFDRRERKWRARFRTEGKTVLDKMFSTEIEAAKKYNEVAGKTCGEFARLNEF